MTQKDDVTLLMNDGLEFAEKMLSEYGEFHPFARTMDRLGGVTDVGAFDGREFPPGSEALAFLEGGLKMKVEKDNDLAVAVFSNVTLTDRETGSRMDAVQVGLEHREGYSVNVLFPYELAGKAVALKDPIATVRHRCVYVSVSR